MTETSSASTEIEFSVQHKAEKLFGTFPYELQPTQDYLFTLYRFYEKEAEEAKSFSDMKLNEIRNIGDMIGFQNYHTCVQSKKFVKDWMKNSSQISDKEFDSQYESWSLENKESVRAEKEIEKIENDAYEKIGKRRDETDEIIKSIYENYDELMRLPEEWVAEPPHPVRFLQHRLECQVQMKKLRKSIQKSSHPLAPTFQESLYGRYLFQLEDSFPMDLKNPYTSLCIIYAFKKKQQQETLSTPLAKTTL
jgi:hypothetical protein